MRKGIEMYIEVVLLILMLALSASFTFSAINSIAGKNARIAEDKVIGSSRQVRLTSDQLAMAPVTDSSGKKYEVTLDDRMQYKVRDLMLSITRFDYGYPVKKFIVRTTAGGLIEIDPKATDVLSDPRPMMAQVMSLKGSLTNDAFYEKTLKIRNSREAGTSDIICEILIDVS